MIRLFISETIDQNKPVFLTENQIHYLLHVMRQKVGQDILLFDGQTGEWQSTIQTLTKKQGILIPARQTRPQINETPLILCPALIKKENMDWVFQKATELGATEIYPLITERTVVSKINTERIKNLLCESAEQCERLTVPKLHQPVKLKELLSKLPTDVIPVCLSERGETTVPITSDKKYAFLIGPEGGWSPAELDWMQKQPSFIFWHLGNTILRAETASVSALACYRFIT